MSLFSGGIGGSALGRVMVEVGLDARPLEAGMAQTKGQVASGAKGIGATFSAAIKAGAILAGAAVIKFGADSVHAFIDSEEAGQRLGNTLKNNSKLSDVSTQSWQDQAHALQELTGIQDVEITSAQAMLGQFDLTGTQVQALIPLVVDLSQKMGIDLNTAVKAVGKATAGNTGSLARFGIQVDKGKDGVAGFGDVLTSLKAKVGGFSESISGNFTTRMKVLAANFKDVEEKVGQALIPVLQTLASVLQKLMPLIQFAAEHWQQLLGVFLAFKGIKFLTGLFGALNFALNGLSIASGGARGAIQGIAGELTGMAGPLTAGAIGVLAFITTIQQLNTDLSNKLAAAVQKGSTALQDWQDKVESANGKTHGLLGTLLGGLVPGWNGVRDATQKAADEAEHAQHAIVTLNGGLDLEQMRAKNAADASDRAASAIGHAAEAAHKAAGDQLTLAQAHKKAADAARAQWLAELSLAGGLLSIESAAIQASDAHDSLKAAQAKVNQLTNAGKQGTAAYAKAVQEERSAALDATQAQLGLVGSVQDYIKANAGSKASTAQAIGLIRQYGRENGLTAGEVRHLIGEVTGLVSEYGHVPGSVKTDVSNNVASQMGALEAYWMKLESIPTHIDVNIITHYTSTGSPPKGGPQ